GTVTGCLDLVDQLLRVHLRRVGDRGLFGGVVDRGGDPVELAQFPLDPRRAGSTRHATDRQFELLPGRGGGRLGAGTHRNPPGSHPPTHGPGGGRAGGLCCESRWASTVTADGSHIPRRIPPPGGIGVSRSIRWCGATTPGSPVNTCRITERR